MIRKRSCRLVAVISGPAAVSVGCSFTLNSKSYDPEAPNARVYCLYHACFEWFKD